MVTRDFRFWDEFYMGLAQYVSILSRDIKTRVGCVMIKDGNILSYSYNGTPSGSDNTMRDSNGKTLPTVLHAEANAVGKLARAGRAAEGSTVYTTLSPCLQCAKILYQSGVREVVYRDIHCKDSLNFLRGLGVITRRVYGTTFSSGIGTRSADDLFSEQIRQDL